MGDNLEFVDKFSKTSKIAMGSAFKLISQRINEKFSIDKPIYQLDEIVKNGNFIYKGDTVDITKLVEEAFNLTAQNIVSEINSLWPNLWEFDYLLIAGGGGIALYNYIAEY